MNRNCLGVTVPDEVATKAQEFGCVGGVHWIYRDGEYGGSPRASIGCTQATTFRREWWDKFKVQLARGWVAFRSPSGTGRLSKPVRVAGKEIWEPCLVCGEDRFTEEAHFPTPDRHCGTETVPLCPTHHRLLDNGRLSDSELMEICRKKFSDLGFSCAGEFVDWANTMKYPYSYADIVGEAVRKKRRASRTITYRICNEDQEPANFSTVPTTVPVVRIPYEQPHAGI